MFSVRLTSNIGFKLTILETASPIFKGSIALMKNKIMSSQGCKNQGRVSLTHEY